MKTFYRDRVKLTSGYLFEKQELNRKITVNAVYDRFDETGRMKAFDFDYKEGDEIKPHIFWDSDVAKWMEGAAYILADEKNDDLSAKVDALVEKIKKHQGEDGYFNIYFTVVEPGKRFTDRDKHELYCAGHLMEAAVAISQCLGKNDLLDCMEKYADYINKVFIEEKSAEFFTPGHEEIEMALVRMYHHTGKKKYLDMAKYFIDTRGAVEEGFKENYNQSHVPVREQSEAVGHAVRAVYLYTGMALVAKYTNDETLADACRRLWEDTTMRKMYVTGGLGSTRIGEAFTSAYDLPNDTSYTETCAGIGLIFFALAMLNIENNAKYADVIERALYNGILSGLSIDGKSFFYENPLEINLSEKFENYWGKRKLPRTERVECFKCSCCPPNIVRLFPSFGSYIYGAEDNVLFVNQFVSATLSDEKMSCTMTTDYPRNGKISIKAEGADTVAIRIPAWCDKYEINADYEIKNGYAYIKNEGKEIVLDLDMTPRAVWADPRILRDTGRICIMRGPIVYCAEGVDNGNNLHRFSVPADFSYTEDFDNEFGLPTLEVDAYEKIFFDGAPYANKAPKKVKTKIKLIPYNSFANRGENDMSVWLREE